MLSKPHSIELSGNSASFFSDYVIPIKGVNWNNARDYTVFYGKDDGKKIELRIRSIHVSHKKYFSSTAVSEAPELTKIALMNEYCRPRKHDGLLPSSREGMFISAREEDKTLQLYYYDSSENSLLFGISVSPSACENYKPPLQSCAAPRVLDRRTRRTHAPLVVMIFSLQH